MFCGGDGWDGMRCAAVTRDGASDTLDGRQCVAEALHRLVRAPATREGMQ